MLKAERLQAIVDITNKEKIVTSEELMRQLNISKATARRDIEELSCQGLIQKTRGGAMSANHTSLEPSFVKKKESNADEKARIAKAARELSVRARKSFWIPEPLYWSLQSLSMTYLT